MSTDAAYIEGLRAQIDAVYRTSGGPEPVMFANLKAKELSADFIDRVGKRKSISVHVKRQMDLCLTALEQAKDAAGKAMMMPEVEEENHYLFGRAVVVGDPTKPLDILIGYAPEVNASKKAKVEPPAAAAASSSAPRSTLHVMKVKHFDADGCPDCKIQAERDAALQK